jgi:hypothetical protein
MGSDRENPGAPNPNGPNGGPQAQVVEQKHWPGPLICYNVVFWPSEFCKISPQSPGNGISESLDSKIFRVSHGPLENSCIYGARLVHSVALLLGGGGASKIFNRGPPDIKLRHWKQSIVCAVLQENTDKLRSFLWCFRLMHWTANIAIGRNLIFYHTRPYTLQISKGDLTAFI